MEKWIVNWFNIFLLNNISNWNIINKRKFILKEFYFKIGWFDADTNWCECYGPVVKLILKIITISPTFNKIISQIRKKIQQL